jgi:predicted RecA/RadA family phage recombinase
MAEATFVQGDPLMVDHTPSGAVAAGEVLVISNNVYIPHLPIAADTLGSVAAGGGVYDIAKDDASGSGWAAGVLLYWDASANQVTDTAGSNKKIGVALEAAADSDTTARVIHILQAV